MDRRVSLIFATSSYKFQSLRSFPGLARSTGTLREAAAAFKSGALSRADFELADSTKRNEISNISSFVGSAGSSVIIAIGIGMFKAMHVNSSVQNNNWGLSAFNAFGAAAELALALPWFILEKRRPGLPCPGNMNIVQAGLWQLYRAGKDIWKLKQSVIYLIGELSYFHLSPGFSDRA